MQEISETTTRALKLAEQRLAEAAAELQRRSVVLQDVLAERDAALAKVQARFLVCASSQEDRTCVITSCMQSQYQAQGHAGLQQCTFTNR